MMCGSCKTEMTKVATLDSGNSKYHTYRCSGCRGERTVCIGIDK